MKKLAILTFGILFLNACTKDVDPIDPKDPNPDVYDPIPCVAQKKGTVRYLVQNGICKEWFIETSSGYLMPGNIDAFSSLKQDGKKILFDYHDLIEPGSACNIAPLISIDCAREVVVN